MAELARTPPELRRLFRLVDFAPQPRSRVVADGLEVWRARRGRALAPAAAEVALDEPNAVRACSFVAEPLAGGHDFTLADVGEGARRMLDLGPACDRLSAAGSRRLAVQVRRLLRLAMDAGEPVVVRFGGRSGSGAADAEALAAPVRLPDDETALYCTLAAQESAGRPRG